MDDGPLDVDLDFGDDELISAVAQDTETDEDESLNTCCFRWLSDILRLCENASDRSDEQQQSRNRDRTKAENDTDLRESKSNSDKEWPWTRSREG